eukprot:4993749-Prymnesium_polylepis.1
MGAAAHQESAPKARDRGAAEAQPAWARQRMMIASTKEPLSKRLAIASMAACHRKDRGKSVSRPTAAALPTVEIVHAS